MTLTKDKALSLGLDDVMIEKATKMAEKIPTTLDGVKNFATHLKANNTAYAEEILSRADNQALGEMGGKISQVACLVQTVRASNLNQKSRLPIIGGLIDKMALKKATLKTEFASVSKQVSIMIDEIEQIQTAIAERDSDLDDMFLSVSQEYQDLGLHIAVGLIKLDELKMEYDKQQAKYNASQNPLDKIALDDLSFAIASLDKRLADLTVMQLNTAQTLPAIRVVQQSNKLINDKFHTVKEITVPSWKNQIMLALTLAEQQKQVQMADVIDKATNDILLANSELLHKNAVGASVASQRLVIDPKTLETVQDNLVKTLNDVAKAQADGIKMREQALKQLKGQANAKKTY